MATRKNRGKNRKDRKRKNRSLGKSSGDGTMSAKPPETGTYPDFPGYLSIVQDAVASSGADALAILGQAQEVVYDAWEAGTKRKRVALAKTALALSDLCADAYLILANEEKDIINARGYYERAVEAGEKAIGLGLGPDALAEHAGDFWGILETRPYMRALGGLSECIWEMGEREESVAILREMLRLNPNDNQGMRSSLVSKLFALDDLEGVSDILETYREPIFAEWVWNMTLLLFRREGKSERAASALEHALEVSPFVPELLTGAKGMPANVPPHYSIGSIEEAICYIFFNGGNWSGTKGALLWVAEKTRKK